MKKARIMAKELKIIIWPDPILLNPTRPVKRVDSGLDKLVESMAKTMYAAPGVGLAANQVGKNLALTIIDLSPISEEKSLKVLINPEIVHLEGEEIMEEGCLSLPGFKSDVNRATHVVVRAYGLDMKPVEIEGEGLFARALQHEVDHLNGKLFPDRISRIKRNILMRKVKKAIREGTFDQEDSSDGDEAV